MRRSHTDFISALLANDLKFSSFYPQGGDTSDTIGIRVSDLTIYRTEPPSRDVFYLIKTTYHTE